jgi:hypothetical protein
MTINDRRDEMDITELVEELELRFPERIADFQRRYSEAWEAAVSGEAGDDELIEDLCDELRSLLRV